MTCRPQKSAGSGGEKQSHPKYLYRCERLQAALHSVRPGDVARHLKPRERVRRLLSEDAANDPFEARTARLVAVLAKRGVA